jgi:hypothetical protein
MITKGDVRDWMHHPITARLFSMIKQAKDQTAEEMLRGKTIHPTADSTAIKTSHAVGFIEALDLIIEAELFDEEVIIEHEDVRGKADR